MYAPDLYVHSTILILITSQEVQPFCRWSKQATSSRPSWRSPIDFRGATAVVLKAQQIIGSPLPCNSTTARHPIPTRNTTVSAGVADVSDSSTGHRQPASGAGLHQVTKSMCLVGSRLQVTCTDRIGQEETVQGLKDNALISCSCHHGETGHDSSRLVSRAPQAEIPSGCHGAAAQTGAHLLVQGKKSLAPQDPPADCCHEQNICSEAAGSWKSVISWDPPNAASLKQRFLSSMPLQVCMRGCLIEVFMLLCFSASVLMSVETCGACL
jgi:hypothetical protein